jgi:isoamylase
VEAVTFGATWDGAGTRFVVWSSHPSVDLCLFASAEAAEESTLVPMELHEGVWQTYLHGVGPGTVYGFRTTDPAGVLFDPYGRAFAEPFSWTHGRTPRAVVINNNFDWGNDAHPDVPWAETLIYEMHVKGFTARHPGIRADLRGTYAGLASPPAIAHLTSLGVTAVELLPVHAHVDEPALFARGLTNYWGYNTLGFFAPEPRLAAAHSPQGVVDEFKRMVQTMHRSGIEVILDVVYNHTAEGGPTGPTLAMRGFDPERYYRRHADDSTQYEDFTGCGNTLDTRQPLVRRMILDSLRYWVQEMHIDGFRFDLASALARRDHHFDPAAPLLEEIQNDSVLSGIKLIAEPWDATAEGYRVGHFPAGWAEWNGRYRDDVRRYWRRDPGSRPGFATRLSGSSDLYDTPGRGPAASINFVTSHDGFTLADLVSYEDKHNDGNGEGNRDGESHNLSQNFGVEGPIDDSAVMAQRAQCQRDFFRTLFASLGVPMISGGDELGRSQLGNNNAYCHDTELTWTPWLAEDGADLALLAFVQQLAAWRRATPALQRTTFFDADGTDALWLRPDGTPMTEADWHDPEARGLVLRLLPELKLRPPHEQIDIAFD